MVQIKQKNRLTINHEPLFDTVKVEAHYTEKDGVKVKYVCTTDLNASDVPVDVYYRETPHPQFGNRYFGLYYDRVRDHMMICNADIVETYDFGMVKDKDVLYYSQSHHDYRVLENNSFIDGGRLYCRSSVDVEFFKLLNGEFVRNYGEDLTTWVNSEKEYCYPGKDCQT